MYGDWNDDGEEHFLGAEDMSVTEEQAGIELPFVPHFCGSR